MDGANDWALQWDMAMHLLAAMACGLLVGIERGWRQRDEAEGARVAGVRTFTLIGAGGGLVALCSVALSPVLAAILLVALGAMLVGGFLWPRQTRIERDATTMIAAMVVLGLGLLAGAGLAALALAGASVTVLLLAARRPMHGLLRELTETEVRAIARFAVIALAVLPFLPDRGFGPYDAWNPFRLWLVALLVTGFSVAGYVANRVIGQQRGTIVMALIGGAYSSTAVTAALATQLRANGGGGSFGTGIVLASAVMYVRVTVLAAVLAPSAAVPVASLLAPAGAATFALAWLVWRRERAADRIGPVQAGAARAGGAQGSAPSAGEPTKLTARPFELLPALGFLLAMAAATLLVRWAQAEFGQSGAAVSLFIAGSFDVDAAIVAFSALPAGAIALAVAALALSGTVAVNMAFKTGITFVTAGKAGRTAGMALLASTLILTVTLALRALMLFA
ncbi:DUF4010 domain-containing protein [Croceicoccus sp. Ery15]|uniref:MgtC/SapB family protein n=1 Tax=Croceicoccus sp. Ery15 TaxID=1703338 RepID=UPI001E5BE9A0|nr:DUF4010 domain-containing protein [Croceicoccus sp. Ery15]